jgi:pentatricopeptide repeat protein
LRRFRHLLEQIYGTLMDIYAREGKIDLAESLFQRIQTPNMVLYSLLIKAYGVHGRPDRGELLIQNMLLQQEETNVHPTIETFNVLINAWAMNPTIPNAAHRAMSIIRFMDHNVKCIQLGIQPDVVTFNTFLKCLAASSSASTPTRSLSSLHPQQLTQENHDDESSITTITSAFVHDSNDPPITNVGEYVEDIINEMEYRFKVGNRKVLPDAITYNIAIQCCANVGDVERVQSLLQRMKDVGVSPNLRTFNTILLMYAQIGTAESAKMAEEQIISLQQKSRRNPTLKPDVYSFNHLYKAWGKSGDPLMYDQIWTIYEQMRNVEQYNVQPDMVMYTYLISILSSSSNVKHLEHAITIIDDMELNHCFNIRLRPDNRHYVPIVYAYLRETSINNHAEVATKIFLRYVQSYVRGRTGNDRPKVETIHDIIKSWIQCGNIIAGINFLETMERFHKPTSNKDGYKTLAKGPSIQCYKDLETALIKSEDQPRRVFYLTKLQKKLKLLFNR